MTEQNNAKQNSNSDQELINRLQSMLADQKVQPAASNKANFKLNNNILILAVLIILVGVSGVQAAKLSSLQGGGKTVAPASSSSSDSASGSTLPSSLQNLPSQVGGC